jgi:hypothetical protein
MVRRQVSTVYNFHRSYAQLEAPSVKEVAVGAHHLIPQISQTEVRMAGTAEIAYMHREKG